MKQKTKTLTKTKKKTEWTDKKVAMRALREMPDGITMAQIAEEMAILVAMNEADEDVKAGRCIPHEEVVKRISAWTTSK